MSDRPLPAPASREAQAGDHDVREDAGADGDRELSAHRNRRPESPGYPRSEIHSETSGGPVAGPPRWITVAVIVVVALLVLGFVFLHLSGGLGPGLHGGS